MTFRARMSIAFVVAALIPLGVLAHGVRLEVTRRLTAQHERRVKALADIVRQDLARESATIAARLEILEADLSSDDRFRLGAVRGELAHRRYVLDWAERAMEIAGLVEAVGREVGAPVLDLTEAFETGSPHGDPLYDPAHQHWTAAGHRLAARRITAFLGGEGPAGSAASAAR